MRYCHIYIYILTYIHTGSENVTPEIVEKVHTEHKMAVTHWRKRKRLVSGANKKSNHNIIIILYTHRQWILSIQYWKVTQDQRENSWLVTFLKIHN